VLTSARPAQFRKELRFLKMRPPLGIPRVWISSSNVKRAVADWTLGERHGGHYSTLLARAVTDSAGWRASNATSMPISITAYFCRQ
jgi:hypothetical protein